MFGDGEDSRVNETKKRRQVALAISKGAWTEDAYISGLLTIIEMAFLIHASFIHSINTNNNKERKGEIITVL